MYDSIDLEEHLQINFISYILRMNMNKTMTLSILVSLVIPLSMSADSMMSTTMTSSTMMNSNTMRRARPMRRIPTRRITEVWWEKMYANKDIVSNVVNAPNLTTLVTAVKAADLVTVLQSDGPFTVFWPDNTAFAKLPSGTVATLLKPENKSMLASILTYHVVSGRYTTNNLQDGQKLTTVQGGTLIVTKTTTKITLTDENGNIATILTPNVLQKNGVAHVIDTVLLPK